MKYRKVVDNGGKYEDYAVGKYEFPTLTKEANSRTPHTWRHRGLLPDPDHRPVNKHDAWWRSTIMLWMAVTGRLREDLYPEADYWAKQRHGMKLGEYVMNEQVLLGPRPGPKPGSRPNRPAKEKAEAT